MTPWSAQCWSGLVSTTACPSTAHPMPSLVYCLSKAHPSVTSQTCRCVCLRCLPELVRNIHGNVAARMRKRQSGWRARVRACCQRGPRHGPGALVPRWAVRRACGHGLYLPTNAAAGDGLWHAAPPGTPNAKDWVTGQAMFGELKRGHVFKCSLGLART